MSDLKDTLGHAYEAMEGSEVAMDYSERHGIQSAAVLTIYDDETAGAVAEYLAPRIAGKTVVEIGGGIGLLALHLGRIAKRVYCIEANPAWSWAFVGCLYAAKPKNVSYLFGAADEFVGMLRADIALCCTHSGVEPMKLVGAQFAPECIDVYGEILGSDTMGWVDPVALRLRKFA